MMPILANLPAPTGNELLIWLSCLSTVRAAVMVKNLIFPDKIAQPFWIKSKPRFATHEELQELKTQCEADRREMREDMGAIYEKLDLFYRETIKASESSATKIHTRVNALGEAIQETRGEIKQIASQIAVLIAQAINK
jgi:hypothetical protein